MVGQVISLGQVIVDLTMNVTAVPHAGEDVFVDGVQTQVGASFNTLYAVRRVSQHRMPASSVRGRGHRRSCKR